MIEYIVTVLLTSMVYLMIGVLFILGKQENKLKKLSHSLKALDERVDDHYEVTKELRRVCGI